MVTQWAKRCEQSLTQPEAEELPENSFSNLEPSVLQLIDLDVTKRINFGRATFTKVEIKVK